MLNRIVLIGRLTRDPESSYTPNGIAIAKFSIAVNRYTKNPETGDYDVDFIDVVAWRRTAEFVTQYATKGRLVSVDGRLQIRSWVAQDGTKRKAAEVSADNVELLDRARDAEGASAVASYGGQEQGGGYAPQPAGVAAGAPRSQAAAAGPAPSDLDENDPFADE